MISIRKVIKIIGYVVALSSLVGTVAIFLNICFSEIIIFYSIGTWAPFFLYALIIPAVVHLVVNAYLGVKLAQVNNRGRQLFIGLQILDLGGAILLTSVQNDMFSSFKSLAPVLMIVYIGSIIFFLHPSVRYEFSKNSLSVVKPTIRSYSILILCVMTIAIFLFNLIFGDYMSPDSRFMRGDFEGAIKACTKKINRGEKYLRDKRGRMYYYLRKYDKAISDFEYYPGRSYPLVMLYSKVDNFEAALKICDETLAVREGDERARRWKGKLYFLMDKYDLAINEYQKILGTKHGKSRLRSVEDEYLPYIAIANCYAKLGEKDKALEYFFKAMEAADSYTDNDNLRKASKRVILGYRGDFYFYVRDFEQASKDYADAASLYSSIPIGRLYMFILKGQYNEALSDLNLFAVSREAEGRYQEVYDLSMFLHRKLGIPWHFKDWYEFDKNRNSKMGYTVIFEGDFNHFEGIPLLFDSFEARYAYLSITK